MVSAPILVPVCRLARWDRGRLPAIHDEQIADYYNKAADVLQEAQVQLAMSPLMIIGGAFIQKGGEIIIKTADGKVIGTVARGVMAIFRHSDEALAALNLAGTLLSKNDIWGNGSFTTAEESLVYHYNKHGAKVNANSMEEYLNKATAFSRNLKGATRSPIGGDTPNVIRYKKLGKYIDINTINKKIISFGLQ